MPKRNITFDAPELAFQRRRYTTRQTPTGDGSDNDHDEPLFDDAYSSDSDSDIEESNPISAARADPIFNEGPPHLPTDPLIACKRHKEIFYEALGTLSQIEELIAMHAYLRFTNPNHPQAKDPVVVMLGSKLARFIDDFVRKGTFTVLRTKDLLFSDVEASEKFMELWTGPDAVDYIPEDVVVNIHRIIKHFEGLGVTAHCVQRGLMVERTILNLVMHIDPIGCGRDWVNMDLKAKGKEVLEDLEERRIEVGGLRGKLRTGKLDWRRITRDEGLYEVFWDIEGENDFRNRGEWLESILANVRVHRVFVRTKLRKTPFVRSDI